MFLSIVLSFFFFIKLSLTHYSTKYALISGASITKHAEFHIWTVAVQQIRARIKMHAVQNQMKCVLHRPFIYMTALPCTRPGHKIACSKLHDYLAPNLGWRHSCSHMALRVNSVHMSETSVQRRAFGFPLCGAGCTAHCSGGIRWKRNKALGSPKFGI